MKPACREKLTDLLLELFSTEEMAALVDYVEEGLSHDLPGGRLTTRRDRADATVSLLHRKRKLALLLDRVQTLRPGRAPDVERLRATLVDAEPHPVPSEAGAAPSSRPVRAFLSYSADSEDHVQRVVELARRLRTTSGIDARLDRFVPTPEVGWVRWTEQEVERADFVLLLCTPGYRSRFDLGTRGAIPEGLLVRRELTENGLRKGRFIPVFFDGEVPEAIPTLLSSLDPIPLYSAWDALVRRLKGLPETETPPLAPALAMSEALSGGGSWEGLDAVSQVLLGEVLPEAEPIPLKLGRWVPGPRIGAGGYGTVYEAVGPDRQEAAVKVFRALTWNALDRDRGRQRFRRGPAALEKLGAQGGHPHIVKLLDPGEDREVSWYAMERVVGPSLAALGGDRMLQRPFPERMAWFRQVVSALAWAHGLPQPVVHRDLAPANVLIDERVQPTRAVVCDFDLARDATSGTLTQRDNLGGHLCYIPPEEHSSHMGEDSVLEHPGARRDLWALGMLLHYLVCGRDNLNARVRKIQREKAWKEMPGTDPGPWEDLLAWLLTENTADRPQSADQVLARVDGLLAVPRPPTGTRAPRWPRFLALLLAMGVLGTFAGEKVLKRRVHLTAANLPSWGQADLLLGGRPVTGPAEEWAWVQVNGTLAGGVDDDADGRCDRCCWRTELPLHIRPGWGDLSVTLSPPPLVACPTEEQGHTAVPVQAPSGPLLVGTTEVPQRLYAQVTGKRPCTDLAPFTLAGDDLPVCNLSWCDAVAFANQLSSQEGLPPAYRVQGACEEGGRVAVDPSSPGYRLPTVQEWATLVGDVPPPADLCRVANVADRRGLKEAPGSFDPAAIAPCDDGAAGPAPTASRESGAFGLFDLLGNVAEWTWRADESGAAAATQVFLGGSFKVHPRFLVLADPGTDGYERGVPNRLVGVRLVRSEP